MEAVGSRGKTREEKPTSYTEFNRRIYCVSRPSTFCGYGRVNGWKRNASPLHFSGRPYPNGAYEFVLQGPQFMMSGPPTATIIHFCTGSGFPFRHNTICEGSLCSVLPMSSRFLSVVSTSSRRWGKASRTCFAIHRLGREQSPTRSSLVDARSGCS